MDNVASSQTRNQAGSQAQSQTDSQASSETRNLASSKTQNQTSSLASIQTRNQTSSLASSETRNQASSKTQNRASSKTQNRANSLTTIHDNDITTSHKDRSIEICGVRWKNPITTAAGTFAIRESGKYYDYTKLGSITTKGVAPQAWEGNPTPRIAETPSGMLNAVGLENPGVDAYIKNDLPILENQDVVVIANVAGHSEDEYIDVVKKLRGTRVDMLEINISCPNVSCGGIAFGTDAETAARLTAKIKKVADKPVIIKLSPNVTDIVSMAQAVEAAGADCISMINTLLGMRLNLKTGLPILANATGGLSGPAILPVAIRMIYQVSRAVDIPIIGMGGVSTGADAYEMLLAGAQAVAVGTAALSDPVAPIRILEELEGYL
ncbi:MAG: dihydroorotate dehydrogenase [Clostridiales Family XIII bacterium]|jgi:dihydroorotate dehydrogenase (NAD+) catalytic subunit|nr:dihydroorotate dehydrogenase [Clostridiales Family XIII bacterium]